VKYLAFLLMMFFMACGVENKPSQRDVAKLYIDILVAEETHKSEADSMNIAIDSLYKEHQITKEEYKKILAEYKFNEATWDDFFAFAQEYLDTLKAVESRK
jgi:hypothetical protein